RRQQLKNTVTRCRGCECEVVHRSRRFGPLKSAIATSIWRQEGYMAPKPKPARFIYRRDGSCAGVDHPNDHGGPRFGCAELVSGLPSSTLGVVLRGTQALPRIERRAPWLMRMIAPEDSSAPPSAALLPSSERCRFFDQSRKRPAPPCECASTTGRAFATTREEAPRS